MTQLVSVRRFVIVGTRRIETTWCGWCTDEAVCAAHHEESERIRRDQSR